MISRTPVGVLLLASLASATPAFATLDLGPARNYSVVATGTKLSLNSGPNAGNFLLGQSVQAAFAGGGGGAIAGTLSYDNTVTGTNTFTQLNTPPTTVLVPTATTLAVQTAANNVSTYAQSLTPTQTFAALSGTMVINSNGGLNVISVTGNSNNPTLTINGNVNDFFVFNLSGNLSTNRTMTLTGGLDPTRVLWNFLGTSGNVFQTSGGNSVVGTFLATRGGNFQFSNLVLSGALINTAGEVAIVSGSRVVTNLSLVPEPGALGVLAPALLALARRRR